MNNSKNGQTEKAPSRDVAVYLDFENLYVSLKTTVKMDPNFDLLMEKCREFGRVTVARAYADWSEFTRILTSQMFANGFEPVYVPTRKFYDAKTRAEARKNSVDIHITIDIVKSLFQHENVDVFLLISGDRDYVPLINQIRQHGKAVYAIGVAGCTSSELSAAVDDMFFYHQLLVDDNETTEQVDVYNQLMRAIRMARRRGYTTTLGILKPIMKELVEGFDERNYKNGRAQPFQKFKDLVLEAQNRRLVRLVTTGAVSEVFLWGEDPAKISSEGGRRDEAAPGGARRDESGRGGRDRDRDRDRGRGGRDRGERGERGRRGGAPPAGARESAEGQPEPVPVEALAPFEESQSEESQSEVSRHVPASQRTEEYPGDTVGLSSAAEDAPRPEPQDERGAQREAQRESQRARDREPVREREPARAREPEPAPEAETQEHLTGIGLDDRTWEITRQAVDSYGNRPPSPRKLVATLKQWRDEGRFGEPVPSDGDIQEIIRQAVEAKKLERVRKGFSTIYRLPEAAAPPA